MEKLKKKLVLSNGEVFVGEGFGANADAIGEIVFNTTMGGYQEIVSDPNYAGQILVMSYPLIGNYGITDEDYEGKSPMLNALIVREYNDSPSNFRYTKTLAELLEESGVPGMQGIDTRKLVRILRKGGKITALLTDASKSDEEAMKELKEYSAAQSEEIRVGCIKRWYSRTPNHKYNIVAVDLGIKHSFIKNMSALGCNVTMVPHDISAEEVLNLRADGLFISNGPGNPDDFPEVCALIKALRGKLPIMGVCLGNELIAKAFGAKTVRLETAHRGSNYPVREEETGYIEIVGQNHGYTVDGKSLKGTGLEASYINVLDGSVEGVEDKANKVFAVQFTPETAEGPNGAVRQFEKFIANIEEWKELCQREQI